MGSAGERTWMSDQTLSETDLLQDLQAFVSEKWKGTPCDRCGTFQWSILPGTAVVLTCKAVTPRSGYPSMSASTHDVEFIPVYCNNCGNTVNIFKKVFDEWRKARRQTT
jgi:hypothetical protein